jgi:serine/threonine protein kinase
MLPAVTNLPSMLDGYRLIRFLGRGGFGEVWLCRSEAMGDYRALKWIPAANTGRLEREYASLLHYRKAASALRSPCLLPIEHVGRTEAALYYIMPLADGASDIDPADPEWIPLSLAAKLYARLESPEWFSSTEVIEMMSPVLEGLHVLNAAGLVHRDVKPDNILFFHGQPCLGDISLLGADASTITRHGTPGYTTPTWYQGGHPDMYGAAATLYAVLTGNPPDRMGRSAFLWPPQGESSLSQPELSEWKRLHAVVRRATEEKVTERYVDFRAMAAALNVSSVSHQQNEASPPLIVIRKNGRAPWLAAAVVLFLAAIWIIFLVSRPPAEAGNRPATELTPNQTTSTNSKPTPELPPAQQTYPSSPRPPKIVDMRGRFKSIRERVIEILPGPITIPPDGKVRLDLGERGQTLAIVRAYESRDYEKCLELLDQRMASYPSLGRSQSFILTKALVLKHLERIEEVEPLMSRIDTSPESGGMEELKIQLTLLEALEWFAQGEQLVSHVIAAVPATTPTRERVTLYNLRARFRILTGNHTGALADEHAALELAPSDDYPPSSSREEVQQIHLNTIVGQWELLEQELPDYAAYLEQNGWPEPQPDHNDYDAKD